MPDPSNEESLARYRELKGVLTNNGLSHTTQPIMVYSSTGGPEWQTFEFALDSARMTIWADCCILVQNGGKAWKVPLEHNWAKDVVGIYLEKIRGF